LAPLSIAGAAGAGAGRDRAREQGELGREGLRAQGLVVVVLAAVLAAVPMPSACSAASAPPPTGAAVVGNPDYMVFDHYYRDPLHPRCQRRVQIEIVKHSWEDDGADMVAHFSGRDVDLEFAPGSSRSFPKRQHPSTD